MLPPKRARTLLEQLLLGRVEVLLQLLRDRLAGELQLAHLDADLRPPCAISSGSPLDVTSV